MRYIIFLTTVFLGNAVFAQKQFSLKDCIDYTLQSHNSVKVYENNAGIAKAQSSQALGSYLPQITGSATMIDNMQLQTTVLPAGIFGPDPKEVQLGTKYNTNISIDVSQTIFDQSKLVAIKANKPYMEMTELQKQQNNELLMYNTAIAYFQVLIYKEQLKLLDVNLKKYTEMVEVLEYQYSKGVVLEKDVDRVRVNLNTTNYQIEDATTKEATALSTLKNAMGMDLKDTLIISRTMNYENFASTPMQESVDLNSLTETKINERSITMQEFSVKSKQAGYLPTLSAVGKFGSQSLNSNFSDAWKNWNSFSYVGLSVNMPLFNGLKRKNSIKEEKLKLENEKLNFNINKNNLQLRYDNAKSTVGTAFSSYQSNKDNMQLAQKVLSVTEYQYQRGVTNLTDFLNDDAAFKAAQTNYINSLYNLMISQLGYQKSRGTLPVFISQMK